MGFLKKLFAKKVDKGASNILDSVGNLAQDIRSAITGDMPPDMKANLYGKILDVTLEVTKIQGNVVNTEIQGNWLQKSWRPLLMFEMMFIVAWNYIASPIFHLQQLPIPTQLWTLLTIGVGGYITLRSGEKIANNIVRKP